MFTLHALSREFLDRQIDRFISMLHENLEDEYWTAEHFLSELPSKWHLSTYALSKEGNILGYAIISDKGRTIHIHKFVVDRQVQSLGIGKAILDRLMSLTHKDITLKVKHDNARAVSFYRHNGFIVSDNTDIFYTMSMNRTS